MNTVRGLAFSWPAASATLAIGAVVSTAIQAGLCDPRPARVSCPTIPVAVFIAMAPAPEATSAPTPVTPPLPEETQPPPCAQELPPPVPAPPAPTRADPVAEEPPARDAPAAPAVAMTAETLSSNYWTTVYGAIARAVRYPAAARTRGAEGTVMLQARIDAEGRLCAVRELSASDPVLSRAAFAAVRRAAPYPAPPAPIPAPVMLDIPVVFRLQTE